MFIKVTEESGLEVLIPVCQIVRIARSVSRQNTECSIIHLTTKYKGFPHIVVKETLEEIEKQK